MIDRELAACASDFWRAAGFLEPFPRSLERAIAWALPLVVVKLPSLTIERMQGWLANRNIAIDCPVGDRLLRASLLAYRGVGVVFLDGSDSPDEIRFSLAHEVAHFLLDYLRRRMQLVANLGEPA